MGKACNVHLESVRYRGVLYRGGDMGVRDRAVSLGPSTESVASGVCRGGRAQRASFAARHRSAVGAPLPVRPTRMLCFSANFSYFLFKTFLPPFGFR